MRLKLATPHAQRGVGLIEVLIAVLVLSFGMLGLVGLQTFALRNNQSALERGMATVQTHTIVDAMRADRINATNGAYNIDLDDEDPDGSSYRDVAIAAWRGSVRESLNASATGSIDCDGERCTIIIQWDDSRAAGDEAGSAQQIETQVWL